MGITDLSNKVSFAGNGSTTAFDFDFKLYATSQIEVIEVDDTTLVETVKTLTTDYTVELNTGEGGTVTMNVAPAAGKTLWLRKNIPLTQPDTTGSGNAPTEVIERMVDRATLLIQQANEIIARIPQLKKTTTTATPTILEPVSGQFLYWDADGNMASREGITTDATVLDEDDFSSDSATAVPTQQSTKAYIADTLASLNKWEQFTLASNAQSDSTLKTFSGLTVGKVYEVTGQVAFQIDSGGVALHYENGSTTVGYSWAQTTEGLDAVFETFRWGVSFKFTATDTTFTVKTFGASANDYVRGDGTNTETFIQLTERNDLVAGTFS